jgi:hypothetical protein
LRASQSLVANILRVTLPIILDLFVLTMVSATLANAAAPPPRPPAIAPPPPPAPVVAPPGVINGPVLTPAPGQPRPIQAAGPAPTGLVVNGTPLIANLSWNASPGSLRYAVYRLDGVTPSHEVTPAGFTGVQFQDIVPDPHVTYRYVVDAYYPNGTSAESAPVQYLSPPPLNPSGFSVHDQGQGNVLFQWQAVPGTITYRLDGPGFPSTGYVATARNTGQFVGAPFFIASNMPGGAGSWRLVALYPGNYADYPSGSIASTVIHVLPPHSKTWLTKPNPPELLFQVQTPAHQEFNDWEGVQVATRAAISCQRTTTATARGWLRHIFGITVILTRDCGPSAQNPSRRAISAHLRSTQMVTVFCYRLAAAPITSFRELAVDPA